ncbi:helix-turn-helix domain-containing protein [Streptomyces sp. CB00455]|uniref:helix-turn-helix domain-containing protein n=1 Tax=Streptomyces sp. CB00455 TaxID=1703927 RepID=UPI000AAB42D3|nr:helix-turn-helix transcriptional regulator [Streptomyces sp. CB00455]
MADAEVGPGVPDGPRQVPAPVPGPGASFSDRLNFLFDRVRPPGAEEYTNAHVARTISSYGEDSYTRSHISYLRAGKRTPTITMVPLLARFFGVEAAYFVEDEVTRKIATQFEILRRLKESGVEQIALRAMGVSAAGQRKVLAALEAVRREEGLSDDPERDLP